MKPTFMVFALSMVLAVTVTAHHSGAAFDPSLLVEVDGVVSKVEWTNPHARLYVTVKGESGPGVEWEFELPSVNRLVRAGWKKNSLSIGEPVTVSAFRARAHPHIALALNVTNSNGVKLFRSPTGDAAE